MKHVLAAVVVLVVSTSAQQTTRPVEGLRAKPIRYLALTNLTVIAEPGVKLENATVVVRDGVIENVGQSIPLPRGATVRDCRGLWCYAGFVEPYALERDTLYRFDDDESPQTPQTPQATHWNQAIHPQLRAIERISLSDRQLESYRKLGFCALHVGVGDGIMRGTSALVLAKSGTLAETTLRADVAQLLSFRKGSSRTPYPSSLMGCIALIRQTLLDAAWYDAAQKAYTAGKLTERPETNVSLQALAQAMAAKQLFVFETEDEHDILRAAAIAKEHGLEAIYVGTGREYRRLPSLVRATTRVMIPLNFPDVPDVSSYERALDVSLEDLLHWDAAPENPYRCDSAGLWFCLTTYRLDDRQSFWTRLRRAVHYGLSPQTALAALTTRPAELLGVGSQLGKVRPGYRANLVLANGDLFAEDAEILSVFVEGEEFPITKPIPEMRGFWRGVIGSDSLRLSIGGSRTQPTATVQYADRSARARVAFQEHALVVTVSADSLGLGSGMLRMSAHLDSAQDAIGGVAVFADGSTRQWNARRIEPFRDTTPKKQPERRRSIGVMMYPFGPFGYEQTPPQRAVLFKGATVWTCAAAGVLDSADVLIRAGKIAAIGRGLSGGDTVIDARGMHLTPGIIDEHSHIAISRGVNEGTHAVTAEVEIGRVIDPDDISIYRQLAGGVTASHLLHGSANPIGGQLQLIKLRWGEDAEGLKFRGAPPTIKFALGENVKQSNWGDRFTTRYPQTRMGVEEIMRDAFRAALEYERARAEAASRGLPFRRDLQLEALLEVVRGQRFIHCHSYVQSEILMLMRLAEEFGFRVQTFTHILEGYKVAREMKEHGATASSFADWWAYKFEVYDAIPQNPAIMAEQGIVTSVNSDDAEMARRLNQEAAKSIKYSDMRPEDALKMCTINPAIQLKVDRSVGSIEVGKDADLVLWNGNPLSNFSRVEQTYVDGRCYFDRRRDAQLRQRDRALRALLEQRALEALQSGEQPSSEPSRRRNRMYHCEDVEDEVAGW
uniref:Amidohydrolase n=1 Tax=uncultured Bacteroidota bacterium TaxID=152509 RepID=H5SIL5_9BACT|nr:amidohydrolase [uncultured Bacteroidetes bacterium]